MQKGAINVQIQGSISLFDKLNILQSYLQTSVQMSHKHPTIQCNSNVNEIDVITLFLGFMSYAIHSSCSKEPRKQILSACKNALPVTFDIARDVNCTVKNPSCRLSLFLALFAAIENKKIKKVQCSVFPVRHLIITFWHYLY